MFDKSKQIIFEAKNNKSDNSDCDNDLPLEETVLILIRCIFNDENR